MPAKQPDLAEEFAAEQAKRKHGGVTKDVCLVAEIIRDDPNGDAIAKVVADLKYGADRMVTVLSRRNIAVSASAIRRHRATTCPCYVNPDGTRK